MAVIKSTKVLGSIQKTASTTKDLQILKYHSTGFQVTYAVAFHCTAVLCLCVGGWDGAGLVPRTSIIIVKVILQCSFAFKCKLWALVYVFSVTERVRISLGGDRAIFERTITSVLFCCCL